MTTIIPSPDDHQPAQVYVQVQQPVPPQPVISGFSVTALVTGIVGLVLAWVPGLGLILGIIGVTFGALGVHQAKSRGRRGFGLAVAGLVCGILAIAAFAWIIIVIASSGTS